MSLSVCAQCSTRYAVGIARCPHCSSAERVAAASGPTPLVAAVECRTENCEAHGRRQSVPLTEVAPGVLGLPSLWCAHCGREPSVEAPTHAEEENDMPKNSVHGGPTNANADPSDNVNNPVPDSPSDHPTSTDVVAVGEQGPEPVPLPEGSVVTTAGGTAELASDGDKQADEPPEAPDYQSWTADELRAELGRRELPKSGSKAEMAARLEDADANTQR